MATPLKDIFFQKEFVTKLAQEIKKAHADFDRVVFEKFVFTKEYDQKALKEKMRHITTSLHTSLPSDYSKAVKILLKVEKHFDGFEHLLFSDYVQMYGVDNYTISINALEVFTKSSAEFAIRPFIQKYPNKTMKQMLTWSKSKDENVRRLASEGCRPRLPWGMGLAEFKKDPSPILPILENLKDDPSEYVRRSVANNLNDISKDNLDVALTLAKKWIGKSENTDKLLKHALRGLLKSGNKEAMELFGFVKVKGIKIENVSVEPKTISIGNKAKLLFTITNTNNYPIPLRVEYAIDYIKKTTTGKKVFQVKERKFRPKETMKIKRTLNFADMTTRKHHPGKHTLSIIVNGEVKDKINFILKN